MLAEADGHIRAVSFDHLEHFHVCRTKELKLAVGDRLQLKANGETVTGRKLANGELVTVKAVLPDGRIQLADGRILKRHYREFVRGYAVTSYASQGKTVDYVLFSDSSVKAATNDQQWYVTASRGKKGIRIFTHDRLQLRENVARSGKSMLAVELLNDAVSSNPQNSRRRSLLTMVHQRVRQILGQRRESSTKTIYENPQQRYRFRI